MLEQLKNKIAHIVQIDEFLKGYNDLATTNVSLMNEWNYDKNINILPTEVTSASKKKVWWKCNKGHEWEMSIFSRTKNKQNCPYCSNKQILKGYNDLATTNPNLLDEWDFKKNIIILPDEVFARCQKKYGGFVKNII